MERKLVAWAGQGEDLHAPHLLTYEVASALTRLGVVGRLVGPAIAEAWRRIQAIPLELHAPRQVPELMAIAMRMNRTSAFDAAYIDLALRLGTELWTLDGPPCSQRSRAGIPGAAY